MNDTGELPWYDECVAVFDKYLNARENRLDISAEMFMDITPGTPPIYRRDALTKLLTVGYAVENNILFDVDNEIDNYNPQYTTQIFYLMISF